jgi:hypothetical protein
VSRANRTRWIGGCSAVVASILAFPLTGAAQCIMCSMSVNSTGERGAHVFRMAILSVAIPTFLMFAGVMLLAYRRRNPADSPEDLPPVAQDAEETCLPLPSAQQNQLPSVF